MKRSGNDYEFGIIQRTSLIWKAINMEGYIVLSSLFMVLAVHLHSGKFCMFYKLKLINDVFEVLIWLLNDSTKKKRKKKDWIRLDKCCLTNVKSLVVRWWWADLPLYKSFETKVYLRNKKMFVNVSNLPCFNGWVHRRITGEFIILSIWLSFNYFLFGEQVRQLRTFTKLEWKWMFRFQGFFFYFLCFWMTFYLNIELIFL